MLAWNIPATVSTVPRNSLSDCVESITLTMTFAFVPGGPAAYLCPLPVKEMAEAIRKEGIPAQVSMTAGTYVCNHVLYAVSHLLAEQYLGAKAGFIHIPYLPEQVTDKPGQPSMSLELSARAVEIAIETIADG